MKKNILCALLIVIAGLYACNNNSRVLVEESEKPETAETEAPKTFLWQLSYEGKVNYLLGSVHIGTQELYPLPRVIEDAFEKSDILVLEADITKGSEKEVMDLIQEIAYLKGEETLESSISGENYGMISKEMKKRGYDISLFSNFKPWFLALSIMPLEMMKMGFSPYFGIEMHFVKKAQEKGMEIMELEGIKYQLTLFDSFPEELQEMFLVDSFLELDSMKENLSGLIDYWRNGDTENMYKYLFDAMEKQPKLEKFYEKLNDERNIEMAEKIKGYFKDGRTYFIVVGSLHIIGEKGIVSILEDQGFEAVQL